MSESPKYVQYEDDPPPCDAPHQTSRADPRRSTGQDLGASKGGGVWLHADHGGPTHACVSLPEKDMKELLRTLDPALHPVIVMGDAASLKK
ncbi:L,D-transpeptidase family protein [Streptomyces sp. NPDC059153]|uniref:L,D-transpeptidase family protein n=1 Tax=Streptomyces sp. NPDC059153 TaxID=3346743 RepID=UPI00367F27C9